MFRLPCYRYGAGPIPVVFLHGYCEGRWVWQDCLPDPSERFTFLAYDLPGFGEAPLLPDPVTIQSVADVVLENIRSVSVEPPVVIGHSMGGYVALALAAAGPAAVAGLGLIHSTTQADSEEKKLNRDKVARSVLASGARPFLETFADGLFADPNSPACRVFRSNSASTSALSIAAYAHAMRDRQDRTAMWSGLQLPLLLVAGKYDRLTTPEMMQTIAACNMSAQFHILEHSGHAGMLEEPRQTSEILDAFLTQIPWEEPNKL